MPCALRRGNVLEKGDVYRVNVGGEMSRKKCSMHL